MATERNVVDFKIHNLTEEQFQELKAQGKIDPNAVYCTPDESLKTDQITNCITEIPQDIKLELVDGVLTLKAGSKVYVPNGAGVFNKRTATTDITTQNLSGYSNGQYLVFDNSDLSGTSLRCNLISACHSGTTAPATGAVWYDTTNNKIMVASGDSWTGSRTLPLGIVTISNGAISSIDQVFNGFGYIGSTVFALPGIKGLIPDGRNEDGTLKNIVVNNTSVKTVTKTSAYSAIIAITQNGSIDGYSIINYSTEKNMNLSSAGNQIIRLNAGTVVFGAGGKITSFEPKTAFHAVDYNDFETLSETVAANNDNAVHKTGNETIDGIKTFLRSPIRKISVDSTTAPSAYTEDIVVESKDTNDKLLTSLRTGRGPSGDTQSILYARKNNADGTQTTANLKVAVDGNGNPYFQVSTSPAASSNSNEIATTAWVNNAAVHKTGEETISGVKRFNDRIYMQSTSNEINFVHPDYLQFNGFVRRSSGGFVIGTSSSDSWKKTITFTDTTVTASAPAASSNSNEIATTAWVKSALSGNNIGLAQFSKAQNGYYKFSNGLIIQWGRVTNAGSATAFTFPTAFTGNFALTGSGISSSDRIPTFYNISVTGAKIKMYGDNADVNWIAIGY